MLIGTEYLHFNANKKPYLDRLHLTTREIFKTILAKLKTEKPSANTNGFSIPVLFQNIIR